MLGYHPWEPQKTKNAHSLWDYHQTCTRLLRADYCGSGVAHTLDGTLVELYDNDGIQKDSADKTLSFEAAWGTEGATCLKRTRISKVVNLENLIKECPKKWKKEELGDGCQESFKNKKTLILNRS